MLAILFVPAPTPLLRQAIESILLPHNLLEEAPDGIYAECDALAAEEAGADALVARAKETGSFDYDAPLEGLRALDRYTIAIRLTAPDGDVTSKTGVTLGSAEISDDANWNGKWQKITAPLSQDQTGLFVELPAASAAVVKLTPR